VSKPIDILDAVPRRQDAMYMLAYLTILTLLSKTLSWEKSATDTHLQQWKESHQNNIDPLSRPMDDITDPVTTSRAYQKLMVFQLTTALAIARGGKGDREMTANSASNVDVSEALAGLRDLRFEASCQKDYLLAMEIYEASGDILPDEYLQATGASKEAIELLHPDIRLLDTLQIRFTSPDSLRNLNKHDNYQSLDTLQTPSTSPEFLRDLNKHEVNRAIKVAQEAAELTPTTRPPVFNVQQLPTAVSASISTDFCAPNLQLDAPAGASDYRRLVMSRTDTNQGFRVFDRDSSQGIEVE
jgi:hypothetical protein